MGRAEAAISKGRQMVVNDDVNAARLRIHLNEHKWNEWDVQTYKLGFILLCVMTP